jgi:hypothetical protein
MGWMDAYLVMEQVANDRLDDAERFSMEHAFRSEAAEAPDGPGPVAVPPCCSSPPPRRAARSAAPATSLPA